MTTTEQQTRKALWVPGWYELDQALTIGENGRLWFYQDPPSELQDVESYDFVFFNQLNSAANCQVRTATIMSIQHVLLGELRQVETDGLDYVFHPMEGQSVTVNAEENPGSVYDSPPGTPIDIQDWTVSVTLSGVSEPIVDFT